MGLPRKAPKTSALLVSAIRKLSNIHGSTSREITNYITSECDGSPKTLKRQMKLALRRGVSAGVLRRSKDGYYTCAALEDGHSPGDSCRRKCGRRRSRRRRSCRRKRRRSSRRRCGRKRRGGRRRHRRRRGMKCGRKRRGRSRSRCGRRRRRKCGGRRHEDGVELTDLAVDKAFRKQRPKRTKKKPKSKNSSKTSSQIRIGSASSADTQRSGADTASLSASGKESFSDQSDISGTSDRSGGETKP